MNTSLPSDPRRLETVISAKDFSSLYASSPWRRALMDTFFEVLSKSLGTELLLRVPKNLQGTHFSLFKNLTLIEDLRTSKLVEKVGFLPNFPDEPPIHRVHAQGRGSGGGSHFLDPDRALWSALGECIERSLWFESEEWYANKVKFYSSSELSDKKLDLNSLSGFSDEQKQSNSLLQSNKQTSLGWIQTKELVYGEDVWVPTQLLSAAYAKKSQKSPARPENPEPLLRPSVTTGLATSSDSLEEALLYGALEAIERDAFMISWLNRLSPPRLDLDDLSEQNPDIKDILASLKRYRLRPELLLLPTDFPFYIVAGVLIDETGKGPAFAIGAKAHWNLKRAILGALSEAASVRYSLKNRYQENVDTNRIGRKERLIYWGNPEKLPAIRFFTEGQLTKERLEMKEETAAHAWERMLTSFREKGYSLYGTEISSPDSKRLGFRSVYVFSPELQPMHLDERAPAFGGHRLKEIPELLGYMPAKELNQEPHPFP